MTALTVQIGDYVDIVSGPAFESARFTDNPSDVPLIKGENIAQGYIAWEKSKFWPSTDAADYERFELKAGDIVLAMDRPWITAGLKWARLKAHDRTCLLVQRVARLRARAGLRQDYLTYVVGSASFSEYVRNIMSGTNVPHISGGQIKAFKFQMPGENEQSAVAKILSAYDELIENNRRRISLLEAAAGMLYREWFVRFRFPGHEHVKIIDGLPEGWTITRIEEAYEGLFDGPHATPAPSDEGPVFLGIQNIHETGGLDLSNIRHVSEADFPRWTRRVTPQEGDIVFSYEATLNRYALIPRGLRCCLGRRMALIRPKEEYRQFLFLHMFSDDWRRVIAGRVLNGATVDRIPLTSFPSFPILLPTRKVVVAFNETVVPQLKLVETLVEQNQKLAQARDLLLPRLMNGEIAV